MPMLLTGALATNRVRTPDRQYNDHPPCALAKSKLLRLGDYPAAMSNAEHAKTMQARCHSTHCEHEANQNQIAEARRASC
jgi:hypothetical protein